MKKIKLNIQDVRADAAPAPTPAPVRPGEAALAALQLLFQRELDAAKPRATVPGPAERHRIMAGTPSADDFGLGALKARCLVFGIDATTAELLVAGLHLLGQQTETALEVAMLQSLRADRTVTRRRIKR